MANEWAGGLEDLFESGTDETMLLMYPSAPHRLYLIAGLFYTASGLSCWCFNKDGQLYNNLYPSFAPFLDFFRLGGCIDYVTKNVANAAPTVLTDPLDMVWLADYVVSENIIIIAGPVFSNRSSVKNVEDSLRKLSISAGIRESLLQKLEKVPVMSPSDIVRHMKMIHYIINGSLLSAGDIHYQETPNFAGIRKQVPPPTQEVNPERLLSAENALLQMVRDGNIYGRDTIDHAIPYFSMLSDSTGEQDRDLKNSLIIFAGLCARAAVEGGLSAKIAKALESHYTDSIEKTNRLSDLLNLNNLMLEDFTIRVHRCKAIPGISAAVQDCCLYVHSHLREEMKLSDIARAVGYTEYYLTKKFHKEMGIRLVDYIKAARIEEAKALLHTSRTIQEISDELQFNARSYFTKIFKEETGITPTEYRQKYGTERKSE